MSDLYESRSEREKPIGDLLKQLAEQTSNLVRQELELAKAEATEKGKKAGLGAGLFGGAGVVGLLAAGSFTAFLIALIQTAVNHTWLAALIVTLVYAAVAGVLALRGKKEIQQVGSPVPEQTVSTLKEDKEELTARAKAGRA